MYTNLPKVTSAPGIFKNDLNMAHQIKIKLCRSGIFSSDQLRTLQTGEVFNVGVIETGIDRVINLIPKVNMTPQAAFNAIFQTLHNYLSSKASQIATILSPLEINFLASRLSLMFHIETFPSSYVVRI